MTRGRSILAVTVALVLISPALVGQQKAVPDSVPGRIDALVQKYVAFEQFNSSILVARDHGVILKKGYGMANFEWSIPNTPDTRFRLGSCTKQFTSMLIMQLVEEGRLSLDDKLADRLPYYCKETGSKVTIHQLLNHTSGIPSYTNIPNILRDRGRQPLPRVCF